MISYWITKLKKHLIFFNQHKKGSHSANQSINQSIVLVLGWNSLNVFSTCFLRFTSMSHWSPVSRSVMYLNKLLSVFCLSGLRFVPETVLLSKKSEAPQLDTHLPALLAPSPSYDRSDTNTTEANISLLFMMYQLNLMNSCPVIFHPKNKRYYIISRRPDFLHCNIIFMTNTHINVCVCWHLLHQKRLCFS